MRCKRCEGLMAEDQFYDFEGTQGFMWMKGWRCMNCGHALDSVIEANHRLRGATIFGPSPEELKNENNHAQVAA